MCRKYCPRKEISMYRTVDFPGVSPRIEIESTSTICCECSTPCLCCAFTCTCICCNHMPYEHTPHYCRPTVTSALRCRYADLLKPSPTYQSSKGSSTTNRKWLSSGSLHKRTRSSSEVEKSDKSPSCQGLTTAKSGIWKPSTSSFNLQEFNIRDAQDRCDRYWCLYRFWQNEAERRRTRLVWSETWRRTHKCENLRFLTVVSTAPKTTKQAQWDSVPVCDFHIMSTLFLYQPINPSSLFFAPIGPPPQEQSQRLLFLSKFSTCLIMPMTIVTSPRAAISSTTLFRLAHAIKTPALFVYLNLIRFTSDGA